MTAVHLVGTQGTGDHGPLSTLETNFLKENKVSTPTQDSQTGELKRKAEGDLGEVVKRQSRGETPETQAPSQDTLVAALRRQQPHALPLGDGQLQGLLGLLDLVEQNRDDRPTIKRQQPSCAGMVPLNPHIPAGALQMLAAPPPLALNGHDPSALHPLARAEPTPQIRPPGFPRRNYKQGTRPVQGPLNQWDSPAGLAAADAQMQQCFPASAPGKKATSSDARPRPFVCAFEGCGYAATKIRYVTEHERTHTGAKPYQCTWEGCNYRSSGSGHMARHMRIHTGDRPYTCKEPGCDYAASQSGHLRTHMRKHTGERPFKCQAPGCSYAASRAGHLRRHMKVHETVSDWHSSRGYPRVDSNTPPSTSTLL